jgi:hypothetical protein
MTIHVAELPMRVLALAGALFLLAGAVPLAAQQPSSVQDDIKVTREGIKNDRQAIVRAAMRLDSAQAAKFWPVYHDYKAEQDKINDRSWKALTDFAASYDKLDDANSKPVLDNWLGAREEQAKLAKKWRGKFAKAIGEKQTLRFFQVESKLDLLVQGEVIQQIPLAH